MRARAGSKVLHSTPLLVLGMDLVDTPALHARCVPVTPTWRGRDQRYLEMPRWVWPSGFPSESLMISQNFSDYPQFYYYYYIHNAKMHQMHPNLSSWEYYIWSMERKKSQVGKQWVGNGKVEWVPPEITKKRSIFGFSKPARKILYVFVYSSQRT